MQTGQYMGGDAYMLEYDVFYPEEMQGAVPALVLFFGGAWKRGDRTKLHPQAEFFSALGYAVFAPDYRVFNRQQVSPRESVEDAVCFWRYIRKNADALRVDPQRIALGGDSAGGHIAIMAGMQTGDYPAAYVLYNPVVSTITTAALMGRRKKRQFPETDAGGLDYESFEDISPIKQLGAYFPPSIFLQGGLDPLVPLFRIKAYIKKLNAIGTPTELYVYAGRVHGFFTEKRSKRCFDDTNRRIASFLQAYLHGPEASTEVQQNTSSG